MLKIFYNTETGRLRAGWRLLLQFLLLLLLLIPGQLLLNEFIPEHGFLLGRVPSALAFILSVWAARHYLDGRHMSGLGVSLSKKWFRDMGVGFMMGGSVMLVIFLLLFTMGWVRFEGFGWELHHRVPYPVALLEYLAGMLLVGYYEELFARGYQTTNLIEGFSGDNRGGGMRGPVTGAILLSSLIFGIMHAGNPNASLISTGNIVLAGIVLAVPYLITGSLAISAGLHAAWNFFQGGVFGFPVSGQPERSSLLDITETGPDLFTGGAFGPEAGLSGIIGLILIVMLFYQYRKSRGEQFSLHERFKELNL